MNTSSGSSGGGGEAPFGPGEIEPAERLMDVEAPAIGADHPLDRHAPAMRAQAVAVLAVPHLVDRALAIELRSAFAEAEQGTATEQERQRASLRVGSELLDEPARPDSTRTARSRATSTSRLETRGRGLALIGRPGHSCRTSAPSSGAGRAALDALGKNSTRRVAR